MLRWLWPYADAVELVITTDTGLYLADDDWRVPDLVAASEACRSERGVETGAALVIEIRSPGDETLDKVDFYARAGVGEMVVVNHDSCELRHWLLDRQPGRSTLAAGPGGPDAVAVEALHVVVRRVERPTGPWVEIAGA